MERKRIPLNEIDSLFRASSDQYPPDLPNHITEFGWEGIPPVPVVEIPTDLQKSKKYFHLDGGHRVNAAIVTDSVDIECIVYGPNDDPIEVSECTGGDHNTDYSHAITTYKRFRVSK